MIEKNLHIEYLVALCGRIPSDEMIIFTLASGYVRGSLIHNTLMVNQLRAYHGLGIIQTLALGHACTGVGLLSSDMKGDERVVLHVDSTGPLRGVICEANASGEIRGYLKRMEIEIDRPLENLDLAPFLGTGFLLVTRYIDDEAAPFTGQVVLRSGRASSPGHARCGCNDARYSYGEGNSISIYRETL